MALFILSVAVSKVTTLLQLKSLSWWHDGDESLELAKRYREIVAWLAGALKLEKMKSSFAHPTSNNQAIWGTFTSVVIFCTHSQWTIRSRFHQSLLCIIPWVSIYTQHWKHSVVVTTARVNICSFTNTNCDYLFVVTQWLMVIKFPGFREPEILQVAYMPHNSYLFHYTPSSNKNGIQLVGNKIRF